MKCQNLFIGKNNETYFKMSSAQSLSSKQRVNYILPPWTLRGYCFIPSLHIDISGVKASLSAFVQPHVLAHNLQGKKPNPLLLAENGWSVAVAIYFILFICTMFQEGYIFN